MTCILPSGALIASALLALTAGCTAPLACDPEPLSTQLRAGPLTGSLLLADAGDAATARFGTRLEGLPELWSGGSALESGGGAGVRVRLTYDELALPSDVPTEMPRIAVSWSPANRPPLTNQNGSVRSTPKVLPPEGVGFSTSLFEVCWTGDPAQPLCCEFGSPSCSQVFEVTFERLDGEPYRAVRLEWELRVHANVNTCPFGDAAELRLSLEEMP